jgi:hypothetical protein
MAVFVRRLQETLSEQVRELSHAGAELYVYAEFEFDLNNTQKPKEQGRG